MSVRKLVHGKPGPKPIRATKLGTKEDTAMRLLREIQEGRLDPKGLSAGQRRACLLLMANGKQTSGELAGFFGVSASCVRMDLKLIRETLGREVREWSLETVVGGMVLAAEKYQAQALKQEDVALAWAIERDKVKLLKELGLVGPQQEASALTVTVEAIGAGYERARSVLGRVLDPRLVGATRADEPDPGSEPYRESPLDRRIEVSTDAVLESVPEETER